MRRSQQKSLGGVFLLVALIIATVALAIIGTLEERATRTTSTETQQPTGTTTLPTETIITPGGSNTSTTTLRI